MEDVRRDCILYREGIAQDYCDGLRELYCKSGECHFYKSAKEYNRDGTRKEAAVDVVEAQKRTPGKNSGSTRKPAY